MGNSSLGKALASSEKLIYLAQLWKIAGCSCQILNESLNELALIPDEYAFSNNIDEPVAFLREIQMTIKFVQTSRKNKATDDDLQILHSEAMYEFWLKMFKKVIRGALIPLCPRIFRFGYDKKLTAITKWIPSISASFAKIAHRSTSVNFPMKPSVDATARAISENLWRIARNSIREKDPIVKRLEYKAIDEPILGSSNLSDSQNSGDLPSILFSFDSDYETFESEDMLETFAYSTDGESPKSDILPSEILDSGSDYSMTDRQDGHPVPISSTSLNSPFHISSSEMENDMFLYEDEISNILDFDNSDDLMSIHCSLET
ncbi:hypothetical protein K7432_005049 [Basidiobolus ranarum]|uniref:Uncharacterized protein n=1 Tax=Basidiobolus ranarum TaxID=34480 RepID=A0ABR2WX67_9FUNG